MPTPHEGGPHPGTIFTLIPLEGSEHAKKATYDEANLGLISITKYGRGIDVGIAVRSATYQTLARLGNDTGRNYIRIKGYKVEHLQCTFEIHEASRCVMLYDRSHRANTKIIKHEPTVTQEVFPFETGRRRRVLVAPRINVAIGMGGDNGDLLRFKLVWWSDEHTVPHNPQLVVPDSTLARTCGSEILESSGRPDTRIHAASKDNLPIRYVQDVESIGKGRFGVVYRARNVDTGALMAVKVLSSRATGNESWADIQRSARKNEVETLERLSHVSPNYYMMASVQEY